MIKKEKEYLIKLFYFKNYLYKEISEEEKRCVLSLVDKELNGLPLVGSFCTSKTVIRDMELRGNVFHFQLILEKQNIENKDGHPIKFITDTKAQICIFLNKGIAAVASKDDVDYDSILSIIYTLPSYVRLKLNPGFQFSYSKPSYEETSFSEDRLEFIRIFFDNNIMIVKLEGKDYFSLPNGEKFGQEENIFLKQAHKKQKCSYVEFYDRSKEGKKNLVINCKGMISASLPIEKPALVEIIRFIHILHNVTSLEAFLTPIDVLVEEYCLFLHKDILPEAKHRNIRMLIEDIRNMVAHIITEDKIGIVFSTIVLNILLRLITLKDIETDYCIKIDVLEYSSMTDFLSLYALKKFNVHLNEKNLEQIFCEMSYLIQLSQGDEESLINIYRKRKTSMVREMSYT